MDFLLSDREIAWRDRVRAFMEAHIYAAEPVYQEYQQATGDDRWTSPPIVEELKARAYSEGLWNLFLPPSQHDDDDYHGAGLSNLEYALCAEEMGRVRYALSMLKMASEVHLVMIAEEGRDFPDISASEYLSRHGVKSELHQISVKKSQIAKVLEGFAVERNASAIVMGAYGHSRMRETLFGGVTKSMLDRCEVPLILAH